MVRYVGEYFEDKKHGYGEFTWPDGRQYRVNLFNIRGNGPRESSMEKAGIWAMTNWKKKEFGKMEKE